MYLTGGAGGGIRKKRTDREAEGGEEGWQRDFKSLVHCYSL